MADLSQYAKDMQYLKEKTRNRTLLSNDYIYKQLKETAKNLPPLQRWLDEEIDPYLNYV